MLWVTQFIEYALFYDNVFSTKVQQKQKNPKFETNRNNSIY